MMSRTTVAQVLTRTILAMATVVVGCTTTNDPGKAGTFYGAPVKVGSGSVRSYVILDDGGKPTELGLAMNDSAFIGLPDGGGHDHDMGSFFTVPLPSQASATMFNHIGLDWNAHGHEPDGVYTLPHFDFHFYMITEQERARITAVGDDTLKLAKMPDAQYAPQGYIPTPGGVPMMGAHWVDPTSPEYHGQTFDKTLIYGFYDGTMAFVEPMITKAFLQSNPNVSVPLKLPQAYQKSGYFPTGYSVKRDASSKEVRVALTGMQLR